MQSLFNFIVQPKNKRYENEVDINGKKLIINTTMDDHKYVSRIGIVKSIPKIGETNIKVGDEVIVHHNVFRRFYNIKGEEKTAHHILKKIYTSVIMIKYFYINKTVNGKHLLSFVL